MNMAPGHHPPAGQFTVALDDEQITIHRPAGSLVLSWKGLCRVLMEAVDQGGQAGTGGVELCWVLETARHTGRFPLGTDGEDLLVDTMMQRLPGFDTEQMVAAMVATEPGTFLIWAGIART